jgi:hypothetical protein
VILEAGQYLEMILEASQYLEMILEASQYLEMILEAGLLGGIGNILFDSSGGPTRLQHFFHNLS